MKAHLMYRDRDLGPVLDPGPEPTAVTQALTQDLELSRVWAAMAAGDDFLADLAQRVLLASLTSPEEITYRQQILADAVAQPAVVRQVYDIAVAAITGERKTFFGLMSKSPESRLYRAAKVLEMFSGMLKQLRSVADEHQARFQSEGFRQFFAMITKELDDAYLQTVDDHLKELGFGNGTLISASLGRGNKGAGVRAARDPRAGLAGSVVARRQAWFQLHHRRPRRGRPAGPGRPAIPGPGRGGQRAGPGQRPHPGLLHHAPGRAGLLRRCPEPARGPDRRR